MVRLFVSSLALALASVLASQAQAAPMSSVTNWFTAAEAPDYNNKVVTKLLDASSSLKHGQGYAIFDWDNTCMYGDISYTSVFYQVANLDFRFAPSDMATIFALGYNATNGDACLPEGINSVLGTDVNGANVTVAQAINSTQADYEVLYENYIAPTYNLTGARANASATLDEIKETTEFLNFRAKISFLTFGLEAADGGNASSTCSMKIAMTVFPQLLYGMTQAEIESLIKASMRWNLAAALDSPSYTSTGDLEVEGDYTQGLRVFNGQETTMRSLRAQNVDVYVVSASPELFARQAATMLGLGYTVTDVYGVRFTFANEKFTGQLVSNYPITWGPGKATIVEDYLKPKHNGKYPIYGSGDSDGDCNFLNTVREGIVHVNNRLKDNSTCIQGFYEKACKYFDHTEPGTKNRYLLQGQDKALGSWIESGFSTKDGTTYTSSATTNNGCAAYKLLSV